ncbi:MAG: CBS domain-containing protein, partial [Candidatus Omnitrophica bacterium]|nr:CBS domain-containing protein [Candidatus Omnitrophota bacterium]
FVYEENPKATRKKFSELSAITVSQVMRKEVITVGEETTLSEAARIMLTKKARRLPVIDKSGRVVGIVARCDVVESLVKESG